MKKGTIDIGEGALKSIKATADRLGFKDAKHLIHYMAAAMEKSSTRKITVLDLSGKSVSYEATEKVLLSKE